MKRQALCIFASFTGALFAAVSAYGQTTSDGEVRVLEEVIVTAQKRTESLQDVPISVAAVTAQDIADINAFDFVELQQLTPGVALFPGIQGASIRVRGVGPAFFAVGNPQSVAVFVDQFAQAQVGAVFSTLVDVERLELLRGPQGTLYGQNAPSGAYNITTASPNFDGFNGYLQYSYSQYDARDLYTNDVRAAVNVPLLRDRLAWRVAGVFSQSEGYVRMVNPLSEDETANGHDNQALRSKLWWVISGDMDLQWTVNYQDLEQRPAYSNFDGLVPGTGGSSALPPVLNQFEDRRNYGEWLGRVTGDIRDTSLHWRWDTGPFDLDVLAFHQRFDTLNVQNRADYPGGSENFNIEANYEITTLEARFSNAGDILDYVAGLYYFDRPFDTRLKLDISNTLVTGPGSSTNEGKAVYASLNFHLTPRWDLQLGGRYDRNTSSFKSDISFLEYNAKLEDEMDFDHFSWSIKLRNYITDHMTAYLSLDHAYKQGGFNPLVAALEPLATFFPMQAAVAEDMLTYDEETSDAIELGFKGSFLNNGLRFNAAIFYQRFDDHQIPQAAGGFTALEPLDALFVQAMDNAEKVSTRGVEFDVAYLFFNYWDMALRAAYADPIVDEWSGRFCRRGEESTPDQLYCPKGDGDALNDLPHWNTNFQIGFDRPMIAAWHIYSRVNWTWQSKPAETDVTDDFSEPKSLFGLTLGFRENNIGLDIRGWVKNLTNTSLETNPESDPDAPSLGIPTYRGGYNPGAEYGVTLKYNF